MNETLCAQSHKWFEKPRDPVTELDLTLDLPSDQQAPAHPSRGRSLSPRQAICLDLIRQSISTRGYPPTLRELGESMGIRSTNGVKDHLRALESKGYVICDHMLSRGIRLVDSITTSKVSTPDLRASLGAIESRISSELARTQSPVARANVIKAARAHALRVLQMLEVAS